MRCLRALAMLAIFGIAWSAWVGSASAQFQGLTIPVYVSNREPKRPTAPIDNLQQLMRALHDCWTPPTLDPGRGPIDVTFRVSFKRTGELFGKPPTIEFVQQVTPEQRGRYYQAVAEALDFCSKMPFTDAMGGAVAGRVFRVNFIDMRNRKQAYG